MRPARNCCGVACGARAGAVEHASVTQKTAFAGGTVSYGRLAGLTYLDLDFAYVTCVNSSGLVNTMEELNISASTLIGIHPEGLAALTALKSLTLFGSEIAADVNAQSVDTKLDSETRLPAQMPVLSCMTFLDLELCSPVQRDFDLSCLYTLNNLRELSVSLGAGVAHARVGPTLSCLSNLESLKVDFTSFQQHTLTLQAPWHLMLRLQRVSFRAGVYHFSRDLLGLTQLPGLKEIFFLNGSPGDHSSLALFGALVYNMAIHCPSVILKLPLHCPLLPSKACSAPFVNAALC